MSWVDRWMRINFVTLKVNVGFWFFVLCVGFIYRHTHAYKTFCYLNLCVCVRIRMYIYKNIYACIQEICSLNWTNLREHTWCSGRQLESTSDAQTQSSFLNTQPSMELLLCSCTYCTHQGVNAHSDDSRITQYLCFTAIQQDNEVLVLVEKGRWEGKRFIV